MKQLFFYLIILGFICSCNGRGGDLMRLVEERDSLKEKSAKQEQELTVSHSTLKAINSILDSISIQEGLIFSNGSRDIPVTRADALRNIERFQMVLNHQKERIRALQSQLEDSPQDANLAGIVMHLKEQLRIKDEQIATLKQELSKKDVDISKLRGMVESQRVKINEQTEAIARLGKTNKAQEVALSNQDKYLNTCYVLIGTKDDLKRKGIIKGKKLLSDGALDKSKFAKVDIREFKEISFEAKRPRILTNIPSSAYSLTTTSKRQFTLCITNPTAFWSISNFLIIQTD